MNGGHELATRAYGTLYTCHPLGQEQGSKLGRAWQERVPTGNPVLLCKPMLSSPLQGQYQIPGVKLGLSPSMILGRSLISGCIPSVLCSPGCVAGVSERQVSHTQHIEGTQDGKATVQ